MTQRKCLKCKDSLSLNEKLGFMECVSGKHIEPINLVRPQWWNQCPSCKQKGINERECQSSFQKLNGREPEFKEIDGKFHLVFVKNESQKAVVCKACSHTWMKKDGE